VHRLFVPVIAPLIEAIQPRAIVEVGVGSGRLTRRLLEAPGAAGAVIHAIDPEPTLDPDLRASEPERLRVHEERSLAVLGATGPVDLALLDGDPNWYSVHSELTLLTRAAERAERSAPLIVAHNVHWPFGRRDGYYDPAVIPPASRRDHSELGLVPGRREPAGTGLRLVPWVARRDFEPRSGVLTAVEDFLATSALDWTSVELPGFHGVAVLAESKLLERRPALVAVLRDLRSSRSLGRQARSAESARLMAELELATARSRRGEGDAEEPARDSPDPEPTQADESLLELAQERARKEALEWRLGRLEEDFALRSGELEGLRADLEAEQQAATESRLRLEHSAERLQTEREAVERLQSGLAQRQREAEDLRAQLEAADERARLSEGRLAHSQDMAEALRQERDLLSGEVERLQADSRAAQATLEEVAEHLRLAGGTRRVRAVRWLARVARAATLRRQPRSSRFELAHAAVEAGLLPSLEPPEESENGSLTVSQVENGRASRRAPQ